MLTRVQIEQIRLDAAIDQVDATAMELLGKLADEYGGDLDAVMRLIQRVSEYLESQEPAELKLCGLLIPMGMAALVKSPADG